MCVLLTSVGAKVHLNTIYFPFDEEDVPGWPTKMALADRKRFFYEVKLHMVR